MMIWCRQEVTLSWNGSYWFRRQNVTWYSNVQGWMPWKWRFMSIAEGWVFTGWLLLNISMTLRWVCSIDPKPKWRYEWNVKKITQTKISQWWSEVSCSRVTCYRKKFCSLSQIFAGHLSTITSLFFNKLEEGNICLIYNSTLQVNNPT